MAIYLSTGMLEELSRRLVAGGYTKDTPAALVYKASWPEEEAYLCTVETLPLVAKKHNITKTALVLVGNVLANKRCARSKLYAPDLKRNSVKEGVTHADRYHEFYQARDRTLGKDTGMSVFVWERVRSVSVYKVWQISGNIRCRDTD